MVNKLKDIFSSQEVQFGGTLNFKSKEEQKEFLLAIEKVQSEGCVVEVSGSAEIVTNVKQGKSQYPFMYDEGISHITIAPSVEISSIELETKCGTKELVINRYQTSKSIVLETSKNAIICFKIELSKENFNCKLNYKTQPNIAKSIEEIIVEHEIAISFINKMFIHKESEKDIDKYKAVHDMRTLFIEEKMFYERLRDIEKAVKVSFDPSSVENNTTVYDIEELHVLLVENKPLRSNGGLESVKVEVNSDISDIQKGQEIELTFINTQEYVLYGEKILLYRVNVVFNAIVKEIKKLEGKVVNITYGETEINPMHISYTGHKTLKEAKSELNKISKSRKSYSEALTLSDYMHSYSHEN